MKGINPDTAGGWGGVPLRRNPEIPVPGNFRCGKVCPYWHSLTFRDGTFCRGGRNSVWKFNPGMFFDPIGRNTAFY